MKKTIILVLMLMVSSMIGAATAETEYWSTNTAKLILKDNVSFNIIPELRFKSELYYFQAYLGPSFLLKKGMEMNAFYAVKQTKSGGNWKTAGMVYLDILNKADLFSHRARLEYDVSADVLKYRDQIQFKKDGWFIGDEIFYNSRLVMMDENRLFGGYVMNLPGLDLSPGILLRSQKGTGADWVNTQVYFLNASIKI